MTSQQIRARDLMKQAFLRLGAGHVLNEALAILLDPQSRRSGPRLLIVLNPDGSFAGTLSARDLLASLVPDWIHEGANGETKETQERRLLGDIRNNLGLLVSDAMNRETPTVSLDDPLPVLAKLMREKYLESLPVLEEGRVRGIVQLVDVFSAVARLALAPRQDGG